VGETPQVSLQLGRAAETLGEAAEERLVKRFHGRYEGVEGPVAGLAGHDEPLAPQVGEVP
jgi:hypothetical protein